MPVTGKLAAEFLTSKNDPAALQTFVNTILAQGWRGEGEELDNAELASRASDFGLNRLPSEVLALTAGVDVQHDRVEVAIIGWAGDDTAHILDHAVVWGSWDDDVTWCELDELLTTRWAHPFGGKLGLDAVAIDAGDGTTMDTVRAFCGPRGRRKVLAIKGMAGTRPWIEASKTKARGSRLWIVGVDGVKGAINGRLARPGSILFSSDLPPAFYEQLASESAVIRYVRGQPTRRFERIGGRRAEALDCTVYAFAARQVVRVNFDARASELRNPGAALARSNKVKKSKWLNQ